MNTETTKNIDPFILAIIRRANQARVAIFSDDGKYVTFLRREHTRRGNYVVTFTENGAVTGHFTIGGARLAVARYVRTALS